jgi:hypothetical protein
MEVKNMSELKLRKLFRGYVFTDFDGNEIGCKDTEQAIYEIEKLLKPDKKHEESESDIEEIEEEVKKERVKKERTSTVELHRKVFELAKEQINVTGKVNGAQIARDLDANASNVSIHLKRMHEELDVLIKKWQDERDKPMVNVETRINPDSGKLS